MPRTLKHNISGKVFGTLRVVAHEGCGIWRVRCRCGAVRFRSGWVLTTGRVVSCGSVYCHYGIAVKPRAGRKCRGCGKRFDATRRHQSYCTQRCSAAHTGRLRAARTKRCVKTCVGCGKRMSLIPSRWTRRRFCSLTCSARKGPANPSWRGGVSGNGAYWKRLARMRDGGQCRLCGRQGRKFKLSGARAGVRVGSLHGHHLIPRDLGGSDALPNLMSLCYRGCHSDVERLFFELLVTKVGWKTLRAVRASVIKRVNAARRAGSRLKVRASRRRSSIRAACFFEKRATP